MIARIEDILWAEQAVEGSGRVLKTNLLGEEEGAALYLALRSWVVELEGPLYTLDFSWDSAFYSVEFFVEFFDLCRACPDYPDYYVELMSRSINLREDPVLYALVQAAFKRLDPNEVPA